MNKNYLLKDKISKTRCFDEESQLNNLAKGCQLHEMPQPAQYKPLRALR